MDDKSSFICFFFPLLLKCKDLLDKGVLWLLDCGDPYGGGWDGMGWHYL